MSDHQLEEAFAHWGPRFVSNGVALTDFQEVSRTVKKWDQWCRVWSEKAAVYEKLGREALDRKKYLSAGEHLQRAGVYYHFAKFLFFVNAEEARTAHAKAVECRTAALPYLQPAGERVAVPYEGDVLYGILRKPAGVSKPPIMVMACGLDSCKEETETYERPYLDRGIATFVFDGPGQGEGEYNHTIRGDYEAVVAAVIDALEKRQDIDVARLGMWGVSLGGYYATRATAFEKRITACVSLGPPYDWADNWDGLPELTKEAFMVRSGAKSFAEAREKAKLLTLKDAAHRITCPIFVMNGKLDRVVPWRDAERIANEVKGPRELLLIDDGNHVANNRQFFWKLRAADWMADQLKASV